MTKERTTFHWNNYTRATPRNLLYWAGIMRDTITFAAGSSILMEMHSWIPVAILILGFILDKAKNFFSYVIEEEKTESITAEFPSGEQVTITHEIKDSVTDTSHG